MVALAVDLSRLYTCVAKRYAETGDEDDAVKHVSASIYLILAVPRRNACLDSLFCLLFRMLVWALSLCLCR